MTEAERAELLALADEIDLFIKHGTDAIFGHDDAQEVASALRRLASQDQKPVAWRYRYEMKEGAWGKWTVQKNKPNWYSPDQADVEIEPLFAAPPPAAAETNASAEARVKYLEDEREALRAEAAVNSRLIDEIADFMGCRQGEELTLCHIKQQISTLREKLGVALAGDLQHKSDCAVYLAPAYEPRECDCGAKDAIVVARLREALERARAILKGPNYQGGASLMAMGEAYSVVDEALSPDLHASDCEKQVVPSGYSEYTPIKVVGSTSEPRGCPVPGACSCPSDRTADVTVDDLAVVLANARRAAHGSAPMTKEEAGYVHLWPDGSELKTQARALLDAFTVGRR